jgi:hypothetical protein
MGFLKNEGTREINYGNCISASRPDRITPGIHSKGVSIDKYGVYLTTQLLGGIARISINNEGTRYINYGNCISASRPYRITAGTHWIGSLIHKIGVYPITKLLHGVARVSIKIKEIEKFIMEILSQLHAPTALPPVIYG